MSQQKNGSIAMWKKLFTSPKPSSKEKKMAYIKGELVEFTHIKKSKKNISLKIDQDGLIISTPFHTDDIFINNIIEKKFDWISKHLSHISSQTISKTNQIETILLLGEEYKVIPEHRSTQIDHKDKIIFCKTNGVSDVKKIIKEFALQYFKDRIDSYDRILEIKPSSIKLTNAKTKWGSCSNNKNIRLSWRLIQTSSGIIDYVICHELAHLKHMNHSKLFWHEVERIYPNYKIYKKQLKDQALSLFTLD
jgi:predicted metal-dependent hydrolase